MLIKQKQISGLIAALAAKVDKLATGPTGHGEWKSRVKYNEDGLVTDGGVLSSSDIPDLDASKIVSGVFDVARIPDLSADKITSGVLPISRGGIGIGTVAVDSYLRRGDGDTMEARSPEQVKGDIGLSNVTNHAQVKKATSSVHGRIPQWHSTGGDALKDNGLELRTEVRSSGSASDTALATELAIRTAINAVVSGSEALLYKGTIAADTNPDYPAADRAGWVWKISVPGKIGGAASGINVEAGDTLISVSASPGGAHATVGADFNIIQVNIDGAVTGPTSHTDERIAVWDGNSTNVLKDGGITISELKEEVLKQNEVSTAIVTGAQGAAINISGLLTDGVVAGTSPSLTINGVPLLLGVYATLNEGEWGYSEEDVRIRPPYNMETGDVVMVKYHQK